MLVRNSGWPQSDCSVWHNRKEKIFILISGRAPFEKRASGVTHTFLYACVRVFVTSSDPAPFVL